MVLVKSAAAACSSAEIAEIRLRAAKRDLNLVAGGHLAPW
jgi:hypothetical protein